MTQDSQFEVLGYFEDLIDVKTGKCLGTRRVPEDPGRPFAQAGERSLTLIAPLEIQKGHKIATVKASIRKPVEITTRYYPLCGRLKRNIH